MIAPLTKKSDASERRPYLQKVFFIVGPTATGKSEIAAEDRVPVERGSRQRGRFPDLSRARSAHGETRENDAGESAASFARRRAAERRNECRKIPRLRRSERSRTFRRAESTAIVVGGSGLYVKALTHGLSPLPAADSGLRAQLNGLSLDELQRRLMDLDPEAALKIDLKNRRRVTRALEICLLTGRPVSEQRTQAVAASLCEAPRGVSKLCADHASHSEAATGVFVFRDRAELYDRIDRRVEKMFADGVIEEVAAQLELGSTAEKALGLREIQALLAGELSEPECIARLQQATRRYAKRQLTWFQRQSNFEPLNLSLHSASEATDLIAQRARLAFAQMDD